MLLRAGLLCDLEGDWPIYVAESIGRRRDVVAIGPWIYTDQGKPVTPGAPDVLEAVDANSGWKLHRKAARSIEARFNAQQDAIFQARDCERMLASEDGWKHAKPLSAFPKDRFLIVVCTRCSRVRYEQIGQLCAEARMGQRTVAELQAVEACTGCRGEVRIELE